MFYSNFLNEIKILYKLRHENIVRVYNYYPYPEQCTGYTIMEYINGKTIDTFFKNLVLVPGDVNPADEIFIQLINAFCYLEEKGIIHRDIRPSNILVDESETVKVIDFGIGKVPTITIGEDDSLATKINRQNAKALPNEYYERKYTILTDMFYLGDMFRTAIGEASDIVKNNFSFMNIINKMSNTNPAERYDSFASIKYLIDDQNFKMLTFSNTDKTIYKNFADFLRNYILQFLGEPTFTIEPKKFSIKIHQILNGNIFEEAIQNPQDVIKALTADDIAIVFNKDFKLLREVLENFIKWFDSVCHHDQELIMVNLRTKLSTIEVDKNYVNLEDIPF